MARGEIRSLTSLRGVAALWVLAFHLRLELKAYAPDLWSVIEPWSRSGYLGVDLFFVLSGYVLTLHYGDAFHRLDRETFARFLVKRLARIYPVYMFGLALALVPFLIGSTSGYTVKAAEHTVGGFIESLLMIQGWTYPVGRHWNVVAWSVSSEWFVYVTFPLFASLAWLVRGDRRGALIGILLINLAYAWVISNIDELRGMQIGLLRVVVGFAAGALLFRFRESEARGSSLWGLAGMAALFVGAKLFIVGKDAGIDPLLWAPLYFTLIIYCLARGEDGFLGGRGLVYLGRISYPLYVVHGTLLVVSRQVIDRNAFRHAAGAARAAEIVGVVVVILVVAHLVHQRIEKPARERLVKRFASGDAGVPAHDR